MKPKIDNTIHDYFRSIFDDGEIEVTVSLAELPRLIAVSEYGPCLPISWGAKRRRSGDGNTNIASQPQGLVSLIPSSSWQSTLAGRTTTDADTCQLDMGPTIKAVDEASSPATPLSVSFSPIRESDERPAKPKRLKREGRKEELQRRLEECTKDNENLKKAKGTMTKYCEKLKAYNLCLKARQEELRMGMRRYVPGLEGSTNLSLEMNSPVATTKSAIIIDDYAHDLHIPCNSGRQRPPMTVDAGKRESYLYPNGQGLCWAESSGVFNSVTTQLPDDKALSRVDGAWARHRRRLIRKDSNANRSFR